MGDRRKRHRRLARPLSTIGIGLILGAAFLMGGPGWRPAAADGSVAHWRDGRPLESTLSFVTDVVLLVDGRVGANCLRDKIFAVPANTPLPVGSVASQLGCPGEVAVFAKDRAVGFDWRVAQLWTGLSSATISVANLAPQQPVTMPLAVWVPKHGLSLDWAKCDDPVASATCEDWAIDVVNGTQLDFTTNSVGILLSPTIHRYSKKQAAAIGAGCDSITAIKKDNLYDDASVNVYFVDYVHDWRETNTKWLYGYTCFDYPQDDLSRANANIVFVSLRMGVDNNLSHELGHALGLQYAVGHVDEICSAFENRPCPFAKSNLMYNGLNVDQTEEQSSYTLGQVYRMSIDGWSWVNRDFGSGSRARAGQSRLCQGPRAGVCPALWEDWPP